MGFSTVMSRQSRSEAKLDLIIHLLVQLLGTEGVDRNSLNDQLRSLLDEAVQQTREYEWEPNEPPGY